MQLVQCSSMCIHIVLQAHARTHTHTMMDKSITYMDKFNTFHTEKFIKL